MTPNTAQGCAASQAVRAIVRIDPSLCDGCGDCLSGCPEGAIALSGGRAELVAEEFCDGLGVCVERCPNGAIAIQRRPAPAFDSAGSPDRRQASGQADGEFRRRLLICCHATRCGRICSRLVKQPGKAGVWCVDVETRGKIELYRALADPDFKCPQQHF